MVAFFSNWKSWLFRSFSSRVNVCPLNSTVEVYVISIHEKWQLVYYMMLLLFLPNLGEKLI